MTSKTTLITKWLILCCFTVVLMIFVGGVTRLTNSGLSIVEWNPITGIIPPINIENWQAEFSKYQTSPEYHKHNNSITLSEFKFIFWLEFVHRLLGRISVLVYLLPLIFFLLRRKLQSQYLLSYGIILILFLLQGLMGWYMVKSGLVDQPYVSHFRLAMHLIIAAVIYHLLFYQLMKNNFDILLIPSDTSTHTLKQLFILSIVMVYIQIFLGALTAGLNAGLVYNTFPLMGEHFMPLEIKDNLVSINNFNNPVFIQFLHRLGAYTLCTVILLLIWNLAQLQSIKLRKIACYIAFALLLQISTGIITILCRVQIVAALLHQIFAVVLLSCVLWGYFLVKTE